MAKRRWTRLSRYIPFYFKGREIPHFQVYKGKRKYSIIEIRLFSHIFTRKPAGFLKNGVKK